MSNSELAPTGGWGTEGKAVTSTQLYLLSFGVSYFTALCDCGKIRSMNPSKCSQGIVFSFAFFSAVFIQTASLKAATILLTKQVNGVEQSQVDSAFFTQSPNNSVTFTNVATTQTAGFVSGNVGAGDSATSVSSGIFTLVGNSSSAFAWTNGNGIPTGITLTFNIQFTSSTTNGFLTTEGNSGTALGNGFGVTQTAGSVGTMEPGEYLEISSISISSVSFSGSLTEPGFTFTPGSVSNARWNRLRAQNFAVASEGARITVGSDTWGFGTSTGTMGSNLVLANNYTTLTNGFETAGPMVFSTDAGAWNLKGLGFRFDVSYDIGGQGLAPSWTGGGADSNWSTAANWSGGVAPQNGGSIQFGASVKQANVNNIANLALNLITFTNGGFTLSGLPITNSLGISNLAGINALNLDVQYVGTGTRIWSLAGGSELAIGGAVRSTNNGNFDITGNGTVSVGNGGSLSLNSSNANANVRLGTISGDTLTMNVNSAGSVTIPNAPTGTSANRLRVAAGPGASAVVNVNNGGAIIAPDNASNPSRSLVELGNGSGALATFNLNAGGTLHAQRVEAGSTDSDSTFNFNGGVLQAHRTLGSTTYFLDVDRVQVKAGGAIVDTTNSISFVVPLTEDSSSPGGGLTKTGVGTLILRAGNTYTGPTIVSNGTLSVALPMSSSAITVRAGATLNVGVSNASWNANSATLDANSTLNFDFGSSGPTTTPLVASTLNANGATVINISGLVTAVGSYPLIDYSTRTGSGSFQIGTKPAGTVASIVTNVGNSSIDLLISDLANDLLWTGSINSDWDINTTANWDFFSGGSGATTYHESVSSGDYVTFMNGGANSAIQLKADVKPAQMLFMNSSTPYSISGSGVGIQGTGKVRVEGGGVVTLSTANSFSGGTSNSLGFIEIGNDAALGTGLVVLRPALSTSTGVGLLSDGSTARTISNALQFRSFSENELNFKLGDATKNGELTLTGPIDLSNRRNEISIESDVKIAGTMTNGALSKSGAGKLTLTGSASMTSEDNVMAQGDIVIDGGKWTNDTFGLRLVARDGLSSRLILTNNGIITLMGGSSLRVAGATEGSFSQGNGTNEFIMYSGEFNLVGTTAEASIGNAASLSSYGRISLLGGTATLRGLRGLANAGTTELVLNGVTVNGSTNGGFRLGNFISGFTNATIQAASVTLNVPAGSTAVASQSLAGSGGVTKGGSGVLYLDGNNTYAGMTVANAGSLGGTGLISGPVTIGAAATLVPGTSLSTSVLSTIGTLTVNNSLSLSGTAFMEVDKGTSVADVVQANSVTYGGTLVVSNVSATPLAGGEVFQLFNVSGSKAGNFSSVVVLPATGLSGTFNPGTGQVTISSAAPPQFNSTAVSGGNLILSGTGTPNGTYSILTSTNVAAPLATWVTNSVGSFSGNGTFSNAIPVGGNGQRFFLLKTP